MNAIPLLFKTLVCFEALAAIAGLLTWKKWKHSYLKWFPIYLSVIVILEISYYIFIYFHYLDPVGAVQQAEVIIEIFFISWFFYQVLRGRQRMITIAGCIVYTIVLVLEKALLSSSHYYFKSLSYTTGTLFILLYLILFFINLTRSDQILNFVKFTNFWICCGMLLFYLGSFPFYGLYNELAKNLEVFIPMGIVALLINHAMYSFFAIGFIWGKPR